MPRHSKRFKVGDRVTVSTSAEGDTTQGLSGTVKIAGPGVYGVTLDGQESILGYGPNELSPEKQESRSECHQQNSGKS